MKSLRYTKQLMGDLDRGVCIEFEAKKLSQVMKAINLYFIGQFAVETDGKLAKMGPISSIKPTKEYLKLIRLLRKKRKYR